MGEKWGKDFFYRYGLFLLKIIFVLLAISVLLLGMLAVFHKNQKNTGQQTAVVSDEQEAQESKEVQDHETDANVRDYVKTTSKTKQKMQEIDKENAAQSDEAEEASEPKETGAVQQKSTQQIMDQVRDAMQNMTLSEKIYQMFLVTPEQLTGIGCVTEAKDPVKLALEDAPVGGLIFFTSNLKSREQVQEMLSDLKSYTKIPLFLSVDEEGGKVARVAESGIQVPEISDMQQIGATGDTQKASEVGDTIGTYLSELGFNVDFAPDSDVVTDVENSAIGSRSFGGDPQMVADMASAMAQSLQKHNVSACMKHFPGLGAASGDTHNGFVQFSQTLDDLEKSDLIPFKAGIEKNIDFIMVGHGSYPNVSNDQKPASMSSEIITRLLREQLGYQGLVTTDALNMGAIVNTYGSGEAAVGVIEAGGDVLLMPEDYKAAYQAIWDAVQSGRITEARIDESVERILKVKYARNQ